MKGPMIPKVVTVACVLRSGGDYDASWVRALERGVSEHLPQPHRFVCLSDVPVHCERIPLGHGWPGWWSKMNVLALPESYGHVLYMDLDTLPVGDLSDVASYAGDFAMIRNVNGRTQDRQSAVMAFRAGGWYIMALYEAFAQQAESEMGSYPGDGQWLHAHAPEPAVLQDLYPGQIVSAKWDVKYETEGPRGDVRLALGHGPPRFSDPKAGWAHRLWRERAA